MDKDTIIRIELAKTGKFGANGSVITKQMLKDVIDTFDGKCPVSLGHYMARKDWWPSWGNVENVSLKEDQDGVNATLIGDVSINPTLKEAMDNKLYPSWSISIPARAADGKYYLHHLAFLGAVPPKIRDLEIFETKEGAIPENAIKANGEGTDFADYAFFDVSDFADAQPEAKEEPGKDAHPEPEVEKKPEEKDNFSDDPTLAKARQIVKESHLNKLKDAAKGLLPVGKEELLQEFADQVLTDDFDFADTEKRTSIDVLTDLFAAIKSKPHVSTGKLNNFSDHLGEPEKIDFQKMADKF